MLMHTNIDDFGGKLHFLNLLTCMQNDAVADLDVQRSLYFEKLLNLK